MDQRADVLTLVALVWRLAMTAGLYVKVGVDHWQLRERVESGRAKKMTLSLGKLLGEGIGSDAFVLSGESGDTFVLSSSSHNRISSFEGHN